MAADTRPDQRDGSDHRGPGVARWRTPTTPPLPLSAMPFPRTAVQRASQRLPKLGRKAQQRHARQRGGHADPLHAPHPLSAARVWASTTVVTG